MLGQRPTLSCGTTVCAVSLTVKLTDSLSLFSAKEEEDEVDGVVHFQCYRNFGVRLDCRSGFDWEIMAATTPTAAPPPKKSRGKQEIETANEELKSRLSDVQNELQQERGKVHFFSHYTQFHLVANRIFGSDSLH